MELNPIWPAPPPVATVAGSTCSDCVWHFQGGRGRPVDRCRRHNSQPVLADAPACPAFTASLDCQACGACCREAFHVVEVGRRDPFVTKHGEKLVEEEGRWTLPRPGGLCVCLEKSGDRFACTAYVDRPRSCRDFERGSDNCLVARRRVHLTP